MSFTVIIPARMASTRLPGKMLLDVVGKPVLQHVYEKACSSAATRVIIATDHPEIRDKATAFSAEVVMTASSHRSGTERIEEVVRQLSLKNDAIVVNVQGDEPMLPAQNINQVAAVLESNPERDMATLYSQIHRVEDIFDPNVVKLVKDNAGRALYFSRAPVPWTRDHFVNGPNGGVQADCELDQLPQPYWKHVGIYAYRAGFIQKYVRWPLSQLEQTEALEQLRVLAQGESIWLAKAACDPGIGVDTLADLERVREKMNIKE